VSELIPEAQLEATSVVVNNAMNRERGLRGRNSYARDLGFDPIEWLQARVERSGAGMSWLDVCCGSGRALLEARTIAHNDSRLVSALTITGLDLEAPVERSTRPSASVPITFEASSIRDWQPSRQYDLVTSVHGLHYVGDKLHALSSIARWMTTEGHFAANFDVASVVIADVGWSQGDIKGASPVRIYV
jgi:ubiquinone/menaquinone biosynthesis C-methylase UbiE